MESEEIKRAKQFEQYIAKGKKKYNCDLKPVVTISDDKVLTARLDILVYKKEEENVNQPK